MARPEQIVRIEPENELKFKGKSKFALFYYILCFRDGKDRVGFQENVSVGFHFFFINVDDVWNG